MLRVGRQEVEVDIMGTRISVDKGDAGHVHCFGTLDIKKKCKICRAPKKVKEKCLVTECDKQRTVKIKCKCA